MGTKSTVLGACVAALTATACGNEPATTLPVKAQVVTWLGFDQASETPTFGVRNEVLSALTDFDGLTGSQVRIFRGGELVAREVAGSVVLDGRFSKGQEPSLRYVLQDGVVVARDYSSFAMLSAYHAFAQSFAAVQRVLQVGVTDLGAKAPIDVFFEPEIRVIGKTSGTITQKFNAFFVPGAHQFGLARRSGLESAPLAADQMVISHEIGHLIFDRFFYQNKPSECGAEGEVLSARARVGLEYAISGINEGMADFVSFAVTGSTDVLSSQPKVQAERSLTKDVYDFTSVNLQCKKGFYCVGTVFARSLLQAFVAQGGNPAQEASRGAYARNVMRALEGLLDKLAARSDLPTSTQGSPCEEGNTSFRIKHDGLVLGAFLDTLAAQVPVEMSAALCKSFTNNFGTSGFPDAMRDTCKLQ